MYLIAAFPHLGLIHFCVVISLGCSNGIQSNLAPIAGAPSSTTASLEVWILKYYNLSWFKNYFSFKNWVKYLALSFLICSSQSFAKQNGIIMICLASNSLRNWSQESSTAMFFFKSASALYINNLLLLHLFNNCATILKKFFLNGGTI